MGVTAIKAIDNNSDGKASVTNHEHATDSITVEANSSHAANMWIPWCDDASKYSQHHITIAVAGHKSYYVWQSGDWVRYTNTDAWSASASPAPGDGGVNGDRILVIARDGTISLRSL